METYIAGETPEVQVYIGSSINPQKRTQNLNTARNGTKVLKRSLDVSEVVLQQKYKRFRDNFNKTKWFTLPLDEYTNLISDMDEKFHRKQRLALFDTIISISLILSPDDSIEEAHIITYLQSHGIHGMNYDSSIIRSRIRRKYGIDPYAGIYTGLNFRENIQYQYGFNSGKEEGNSKNFDEGYSIGKSDGFDQGYEQGKDEGFSEAVITADNIMRQKWDSKLTDVVRNTSLVDFIKKSMEVAVEDFNRKIASLKRKIY